MSKKANSDEAHGVLLRESTHAIRQGAEVTPSAAGVKLVGPLKWIDGTSVKLVWIQLCELGSFKGHASGPFEITIDTFDEVCLNFRKRGLPLAFDYEHASEQDPTSGSIPTKGAPACGWIHDLVNKGPDGLWGLVEWLDDARTAIKAGKYAYVSPALRLGSKDPKTGASQGARLSSAALVNAPFLKNLPRLIAAKDGDGGYSNPLPHEHVLPALTLDGIKACKVCSDRITKIAAMGDDSVYGDPATMSEADKSRLLLAEGEASKATLLLREATATIESQSRELVELRADKARRDEADLTNEVDIAYRTYKDAKKLGDKDKEHLLRIARGSRESFRAMYPVIATEHAHLLRELPPEPRPPKESKNSVQAIADLTQKNMDLGMGYIEARSEAQRALRGQP